MRWIKRAFVAFTTVMLCVVLAGCSGTDAGGDSTAESADDGSTTAQTADNSGEAAQPATDESSKAESAPAENAKGKDTGAADKGIAEDGTYTSKDEVALYLHTYGHLPSNFITKSEAEDAGWKTEGLNLDEACPGKSIGGDKFSNREGKLPKKKGRTWYECDIDYRGGSSRGAKRIVYSNDGLIYYTGDHYQSFERLYGEEK